MLMRLTLPGYLINEFMLHVMDNELMLHFIDMEDIICYPYQSYMIALAEYYTKCTHITSDTY